MKKSLPEFFNTFFSVAAFLLSVTDVNAQELYLGPGSQFFYDNSLPFTTSNTVVSMDSNASFILNAGNNWGSSTEYVDGKVSVTGSGTTYIPVGNNGKFAPVKIEHTSDVSATYFNATPTSGTLGTDVDAVSDKEYWNLTGSGIVTLYWNDQSDITSLVNNNGGKLSSVAVVGLQSGTWNLASSPQTNLVNGDLLNGDVTSDPNVAVNLDAFSEFTFGIDHQAVLSVDDLFGSNAFAIISNPVEMGRETIDFTVENDLSGLDVSLFDITGRKLKEYKNVKTSGRLGSIKKPNLRPGIYFIKFVHEGKQGVKKIIIN